MTLRPRSLAGAAALTGVVCLGLPAPAAHAGAAYDPTVQCDSFRNSLGGVIVFSATAYVPDPQKKLVSLRVSCSFTGLDQQHTRYTTTNEAPTPVVNASSAGPMGAGGFIVMCGTARATYADGDVGTGTFSNSTRC